MYLMNSDVFKHSCMYLMNSDVFNNVFNKMKKKLLKKIPLWSHSVGCLWFPSVGSLWSHSVIVSSFLLWIICGLILSVVCVSFCDL